MTHSSDYVELPERLRDVTAKISTSRKIGEHLMREWQLINKFQPAWNKAGKHPVGRRQHPNAVDSN